MMDVPNAKPELAAFDPVGWHHAEQLALRANQATGPAQGLLHAKHQQALQNLHDRWQAAQTSGLSATPRAPDLHGPLPLPLHLRLHLPSPSPSLSPSPRPSPLAQLVHDMALAAGPNHSGKPPAQRAESPRVAAFRQQLGHISVQKQVTQAMAQAPQNAGPINSHMLVLRSLGLMQDASPNYLNRFMGYVQTLLHLDEAASRSHAHKTG